MNNKSPNRLSNKIHLIGGQLRRRAVIFPTVSGLRPTSSRIRETLFNWLGQDLTGKNCLDLFAGSGALGFEAASRYAKYVAMVEIAKTAYCQLLHNRAQLGLQQKVELLHQSALSYLFQNQIKFDIIFLDPPFSSHLLLPILSQIASHIAPQGIVYIEARKLPVISEWNFIKRAKAGEVQFGLINYSADTSSHL